MPDQTQMQTSDTLESPLTRGAAATGDQASRAQDDASRQSHQDASNDADGGDGADAAAPKSAPARPEGIPDDLWDDKAGVKFADVTARLKELDDLKKADIARAAGVPEKPDGYKLELPKDFKLPDGYGLDPNNPMLPAARELAHANKWGQEEFSQLVKLDALRLQTEDAARKAHVDAEVAKLGEKAPARIDAVTKWIGSIADNKEDAKQTVAMLWSAGAVRVFEKAMKAAVSQGVDGLNSGGREEAAEKGKIEGFENMSFEQRRIAQMNMNAA